MTRGDLPRISIWGRPFKPVAFGLSISMCTVLAVNVAGDDRGTQAPLTTFLAVAASAALTMLLYGWWARSQLAAEAGLLLVVLTYMTRAAFIYLSSGWDQAVAFSVASSVIAGGAYLLEAADHGGRGGWWTRHWFHSSPR